MSDFGIQRFMQFGDPCMSGPSSSTDTGGSPTGNVALTLKQMLGETLGKFEGPSHNQSLMSGMDPMDGMGPMDFGTLLNGPLDMGIAALRNSTKTLKCPKCNWHYKYQETLEIHMKEKHSDTEVKCMFCVENRAHPKLARGETYSCGYKPYRCELCKYSTTTKGNLSIHMQSDKHLHAVQELPNSIVAANMSVPVGTARSPTLEGDKAFVCGVCGTFTTDSLAEMIAHADKDRSRPGMGDVSAVNGFFRCHLCPYNTNLKANFQLHTRTDKHLQRVQMINHIREGSAGQSTLCRLASTKSPFQVLCRPCQEVFSSAVILREHCEGVSHRCALRLPVLNLVCRICGYSTPHRHEALNHMTCHEETCWQNALNLYEDTESADGVNMEEESAFACSDCHFTTKDSQELEEHAKTHELGEQCPLCSERPTVLNDHLIADHKIAESAVEKLLAVHRADIQPVVGVQFAFRCPQCPLAFRSETALQTHSLAHIFKPQHACPVCAHQEDTAGALVEHMNKEHPSENTEERRLRCELCQETFVDKKAMLSHLNSVNHLHRAKKQLEQQGGMDLNAQLQALAALNAPASPSERKPFRCNVCKIGYGQGATLDIHLRSVAHQSRMSKIAELVTSGDIDPSRPVLEQPGGPQQRLIRDLVSREEEGAAAQQNAMAMFNNILNMAQLLQMAGGQNAGFPGSSQPSTSSDTEEDVPPKTANALKAILEVYGLDQLSEAAQIAVLRLDEVADDRIAELSKVDCDTCGQTCVSVLALRSHCEDSHDGIVPDESINKFGIKLQNAIDEIEESVPGSRSDSRPPSRDNSEPPEKRSRTESSSTPGSGGDGSQAAQLALLNMMQAGFPFMPPNPFMPMEGFFNPLMAQQMASMQSASSPAKRARTKITDDQLKVLRTYFDINNSPTEAQIHEMSLKTQLPEKVIKHWFRNTLFKERQRDKDSPYNFSNPPQMSIDLDTYDKTGETKVTLNSEPVSGTSSTSGTQSSSLDIKKPVKEEPREIPTPCSVSSAPPVSQPTATVTTPSLAALIGLQQQNPFAFMQDEKAFSLLTGSLNQLPSQHQPSAAGRRANRTRFTDFQLRTLQQFFDKQAYPKDDDLEVLSKKLQLSPRVIVVWFQNARQKARKIYENQPNAENNDRFVRTPGCNFQCKRCQLVFQRYYELIQHQQKKCYKDDSQALLQDNKSVEDNLTDEERMQIVSESRAQAIAQPATPTPADILKLLGQGKSSTEALLKMCESARTPVAFHKRCPFCCLLFRSRQSLADHLPQKHPEQMLRVPVDVDLLPSADDVPSLSSALLQSEDSRKDSTPLDLSSSSGDRADSLSVSPYLGGSDGDDNMDDSFSSFGRSESQGPGGASRSPASNKRYRTHLTPMQVHMMKYIFSEYKTPSMSECEALGRDIGLHKRVVQVWFQNARAKERKSRMQNGQDEDMSRSTATSCTLCGVEYSGRLTMQDHLFSATHLAVVRAMHKGDADPEPRPTDENGLRLRTSTVRDCHKKSTTPLNSAPSFPFNLMNFGLQPGGLSMIYDPTVMGTPIPLLQIPESVMTQITSDMSEGKSSTKFTQDGLSFDELLGTLDDDNARCAAPKDCEVGWACPGCSNVFQQESLLKNHQRAICTSTDSSFTLIQTHYECIACETQFGSQSEYRTHLDTPEHVGARAALLPMTAVSSAASAATPLAGAM